MNDYEKSNKLAANIWVELREITWQNPGAYLTHKSNLLSAVQQICNDLNIKYVKPVSPVVLTKEKEL